MHINPNRSETQGEMDPSIAASHICFDTVVLLLLTHVRIYRLRLISLGPLTTSRITYMPLPHEHIDFA